MRPNIDSCFDLLASGKFNDYLDIIRDFHTIITVNKGFVKIEDNWFLVYIKLWITICTGLAIQLDDSPFCLLLCWNSPWFKSPNILSWHGYMFAGKWTLFFVELQYFRDIVDIVSRGVWIETRRKIVLSFINLSDEFLQGVIGLTLWGLFIEFCLLKPSYSFLFLVL